MKVAVSPTAPAVAAPCPQRLADYVELTKPRIAVMVLVTVAAGYLMAAGIERPPRPPPAHPDRHGPGRRRRERLEHVGRAGDRRPDAPHRQPPAARRPPAPPGSRRLRDGPGRYRRQLPVPRPAEPGRGPRRRADVRHLRRRLHPAQAGDRVQHPHRGRPRALPPVIGWCAATGTIGWDAVALFLVLLFWQLPHFMAIAWMYRQDYGRAGPRMIPVADPTGRKTSRSMIVWCVVLVAASLLPLAPAARWTGCTCVGAAGPRGVLPAEHAAVPGRPDRAAGPAGTPGVDPLPAGHDGSPPGPLGRLCTGCSRRRPGTVRAADISIPVPDFTLTERSGKKVSRDDLKGKVWVASFVFTRCTGPCPQVTATMARLQKELDLKNTAGPAAGDLHRGPGPGHAERVEGVRQPATRPTRSGGCS